MNDATAETETPEEMGRRNFLVYACGILAAPLAVAVVYPRKRAGVKGRD